MKVDEFRGHSYMSFCIQRRPKRQSKVAHTSVQAQVRRIEPPRRDTPRAIIGLLEVHPGLVTERPGIWVEAVECRRRAIGNYRGPRLPTGLDKKP